MTLYLKEDNCNILLKTQAAPPPLPPALYFFLIHKAAVCVLLYKHHHINTPTHDTGNAGKQAAFPLCIANEDTGEILHKSLSIYLHVDTLSCRHIAQGNILIALL